MLTLKNLRENFISFFKEKNHTVIPSSSLVPKDDPTLLFTTAGMVQFKPMFAGAVNLTYTRAASVQKCLRTSDLELVGKTKRHLSFFEMLGNFSFGDYFKKEAIDFAWEFSTEIIKFPKEKIWVSIYQDDDEAFDLWHQRIGIPKEKIVRLGKEDNFWGPAGDSGACGPCSELYLDRGEAFGCGSSSCQPGCDCERFLEFWNLVFNQYNQDLKGNLKPLPQKGIDTGMGLERLGTLVQGVDSVYETDEFKYLIDYIFQAKKIKDGPEKRKAVNIIAEHSRAIFFAMSDGIYPANEGRGYVLRRILRRALFYTRSLGINEPFIFEIIEPVLKSYGWFYPELQKNASVLKPIILNEEKRFLETLENGLDRLNEIIKKVQKEQKQKVAGKDLFVLYDTFGFPLEMTMEIAEEKNLKVDLDGFKAEMDQQKARGKKSWKGGGDSENDLLVILTKETEETIFSGYQKNKVSSQVIGLADNSSLTKNLDSGSRGILVLKETSFYGESGGQVGDRGEIKSKSGSVFKVLKTKKLFNRIFHFGEVITGKFSLGLEVMAEIDIIFRNLVRANHTATHLLQGALRSVLGSHVKQAGSLVESERMRFDFSHFAPLTEEEIDKVQNLVNEKIWQNILVGVEELDLEEALKKGALAVFDEKYDQRVRVVSVEDFSKELCGGTHVNFTGEIGLFKILKEFSPGSGVRRIEAVTLKGAFEKLKENDKVVSSLITRLKTKEEDLLEKVEYLLDEKVFLEKELKKLKAKNSMGELDRALAEAEKISGQTLMVSFFKGLNISELKKMVDVIKNKEKNFVVCFGSEIEGKVFILLSCSGSLAESGKIDCRDLIKELALQVGGKGGGRADMAQAGGDQPQFLEKALQQGKKIIRSKLEEV